MFMDELERIDQRRQFRISSITHRKNAFRRACRDLYDDDDLSAKEVSREIDYTATARRPLRKESRQH